MDWKIVDETREVTMNVLFLSPWYPNRYDAMDGLFIRKHAQAVARYVDNIEVICMKPCCDIDEIETTSEILDGVHEVIVYYPNPKNLIKKLWQLYKAFDIGYKRTHAKPDIVQVNVLTRYGVIGYLLRRLKGIPYVIVEHWSRYHREGKCFSNWAHKLITQIVVRNAECVMPVSNHLADAMQIQGLSSVLYSKVNNVVDDFFFDKQWDVTPREKKRILHISCFDERAKNIKGILRATREVMDKRNDFELVLIGTGNDYEDVYREYEKLGFPQGVVRFVGEQTPREVCDWLRNSDFMVMFSNYENAPVVISEALAVGIPVVSTNVGGISEMIDSKCGILIEPRNESQLSKAIMQMLDTCDTFDKSTIKEYGNMYTYDEVGRGFVSIYKSAISLID